MWLKQSPRRTWSSPVSPALTRHKLRSTSWWRKTAIPVSSSPQCTWSWPVKPGQAKTGWGDWYLNGRHHFSFKVRGFTDARGVRKGSDGTKTLKRRSFLMSHGVIYWSTDWSGSELEAEVHLKLGEERRPDGERCVPHIKEWRTPQLLTQTKREDWTCARAYIFIYSLFI